MSTKSLLSDADALCLKEALVRLLVETQSLETSLDSEDKKVLTDYGLGLITEEEFKTFFRQKAERIQRQIERPQ